MQLAVSLFHFVFYSVKFTCFIWRLDSVLWLTDERSWDELSWIQAHDVSHPLVLFIFFLTAQSRHELDFDPQKTADLCELVMQNYCWIQLDSLGIFNIINYVFWVFFQHLCASWHLMMLSWRYGTGAAHETLMWVWDKSKTSQVFRSPRHTF